MKLVRSHQILRFLRDRSIHRGKQFRADRGIQYIHQHCPQFLFSAGVRIILYQMPYQRLRNSCIDSVHGHMIAVISRPPESQLRHIPGSHHKGTLLVGNVHQHLRALPRLSVLVSNVMLIHVLSDIFKMPGDRPFYIDLPQTGSQRLCHLACIFVSPVRRSEAGHCHRYDILPSDSQHIKSAHRYEQRQRGIQTAGNTYHRLFTTRMLITLPQSP